MKISIFGLGYVGVVTVACLSQDGHEVIGVDVNQEKVDMVAKGKSPIVEPGLENLLSEGVRAGLIKATNDAKKAVEETDVSFISVGTPPTDKGGSDLRFVYKVCREIASAIREKGLPHVIILRSTVPPGTLEYCRKLFSDYVGSISVHLAFNPEFLREGSAVEDYYSPPYTVIGADDSKGEDVLRDLYSNVDAPIINVKPSVAEMVKCVANAWHANKVAFANEVGRIAKAYGVDGRAVMDVIIKDVKLNVSPAYMRPGFAYGGSCLPKDVGALINCAREQGVEVPLLSALPQTNELQVELAVKETLRLGAKKVSIWGLAFKKDTDDLRESPSVLLVKKLLGEGMDVRIYDPSVYRAKLMGTNLEYIKHNLPHFEGLLVSDISETLTNVDTVVVTYSTMEFRQTLTDAPRSFRVLDLAGLWSEIPEGMEYYGIGW